MQQVAQQVLYWIQEMELHMLYQFMKVLLCLIALWGLILQDEMCQDISGEAGQEETVMSLHIITGVLII
jgi:hypothetical protein